ncbi:uncharacterized protein UTRI_04196_B [Ustilago trichophora]|uniref:Uncharacterized protein n=1 Tax=Ustilago trichophora TaxID=86804 RepID=A0A5C3EAU0_9BASI|nr:uncharacterized protein UTRI_04196_B [Ustilago trichophora]
MAFYVLLLSCFLLIQTTFALYTPVRSPAEEALNHLSPLEHFSEFFDPLATAHGGAPSSNPHTVHPVQLPEGSHLSPGPAQWPSPQTFYPPVRSPPEVHLDSLDSFIDFYNQRSPSHGGASSSNPYPVHQGRLPEGSHLSSAQQSQYANPQHWQGTHHQESPYPQSSSTHAPNYAYPVQDHANLLTPQHAGYPSSSTGYPHSEASQPMLQDWNQHAWRDSSSPEHPATAAQSHADLHQENEPEAGNDWDMYIRMLQAEHPYRASGASNSASSGASEVRTSASPEFPQAEQQQMSKLVTDSNHFPIGELSSVDPLEMANKPLHIGYQQDKQTTEMITDLKSRVLSVRAGGRRQDVPKAIVNAEAFLRHATHYLTTIASFVEVSFGSKRFLLSHLSHVVYLFPDMDGAAVLVWELKTDGAEAFMLSRGAYNFRREYWNKLVEASPNAIYDIHAVRSWVDNTWLLSVQKNGNGLKQRVTPRRLAVAEDPDRVVLVTSVSYSPEEGLGSALQESVNRHLKEAGLGDEARFSTKQEKNALVEALRTSLSHRNNMWQIKLHDKPYFLTHSRTDFDIKGIPKNYVTIWRQRDGDSTQLVAVGIFPLSVHHFQRWVRGARPASVTIHVQLQDWHTRFQE